jgi:hypothetical protein
MKRYCLLLLAGRLFAANISGVWANDGGDKVTQDELRVSNHTENLTGTVKNRVWNGSKISLFGARNETVSFNLTLEAAKAKAVGVQVAFDVLTGPNNAKIRTTGKDPMDFTNRPIELFYERYVRIDGLSFFGYSNDNSQIPKRFQAASGNWADRPDHDKMYPDALVPMELIGNFGIAQGQNQSVWADIFIPKGTPAGLYKGSVKVSEAGKLSRQIPVELTVKNFDLPDSPTAKTMVFVDNSDIEYRYVCGNGCYAQWDQPGGRKIQAVMDKYYQFLHRHRLSAIGENECPPNDAPCQSSLPRLDGSLFTKANGYDGPGVGVPNGVYSIGTYGTWGAATWDHPDWKHDQAQMTQHLNGFGSWFLQNLPKTDVFLYLQDEPGFGDFGQVQQWANWMKQNQGPGSFVKSFSTVSSTFAQQFMPDLQVTANASSVGNCPLNANGGAMSCDNVATTKSAFSFFGQPNRKFWMYNDGRPGAGTFDTESDGVDPRVIPVAQYKMGVDRWYYWMGDTNGNFDTFMTATSWGWRDHFDNQRGMWSDYAPTNGNGLLFYPGTDVGHTANSYGMGGPIASIRLKNWRRGVQDVEYFALASQKSPKQAQALLNTVMPKALWENAVQDPFWPITPISWSSNPDTWELVRSQLASLIAK